MLVIRAEEETDETRILEIQAAAFERQNEADLVAMLRRAADPHISLVAEDGGRVLGHIFFSPVEIESSPGLPDLPDQRGLAGLAPVAVDPAHQGRGVGSALIRAGLAACPALGWGAVFLVGDPRYYARFGFVMASPKGFTYGSPLFDSVLQVHELSAGALDGHGGRVRFHRAFGDTGCG